MLRSQLFFLLLLLIHATTSSSKPPENQDFSFWEKRAQHAISKKNTAKALVALLRAEKKGAPSQRIWAIQQRVELSKTSSQNPSLELAIRIATSFFLDFPVLAALILLSISLLFMGYLFSRARNLGLQNKKRVIFLLTVLCVISVSRISLGNQKLGVALVPGVELYAGPGENFPIICTIPHPSIISIKARTEDFVKIAFSTQKGWCKKRLIEPI